MRNMNKSHKKMGPEKGFSLIEVLVSALVLAAGILAVVSFHSVTLTNTSEAKVKSEAIALAEATLEDLRGYLSETDARLASGSGLGDYSAANDSAFNSALSATFSRTYTVTGTNPKIAAVTVSWTDRLAQPQSVTLKTDIYVTDPTEGVRDLAQVFANNGAGSGGSWEYPPDTGDIITGDREVVEQVPVGDYAGEVPDGYEFENVYIFRIYLTGDISRSHGASTDEITIEDIVSLTIDSIDGVSDTSYTPVCTSGSNNYTCILYYLSTTDGWTGDINYLLTVGDTFCNISDFESIVNVVTGTTRQGAPILQAKGTASFSNETDNFTFDLVVDRIGGC